MINFRYFQESIEKELNRKLNTKEVEFLQSIFARYLQERQIENSHT